ncbi:MAG: hypothetical protein WA666_01130 [Nitrospirota bacterium]
MTKFDYFVKSLDTGQLYFPVLSQPQISSFPSAKQSRSKEQFICRANPQAAQFQTGRIAHPPEGGVNVREDELF